VSVVTVTGTALRPLAVILTQFHVVYDDWFTTVSSDGSLDNIENSEQWIEILTTLRERVFDHDEPMVPPVAEDWFDENELLEQRLLENQHKLCRNKVQVGPWDVLLFPATPDDEENEVPIEIVEDDNGENEANMGPDVVSEQPQPDPLEGRRYPLRLHTCTQCYYGDEWINQSCLCRERVWFFSGQACLSCKTYDKLGQHNRFA
jgi:hypothetical protein